MIKSPVLLAASLSAILGIMMGVLGTAFVMIQTTVDFARIGTEARTETNIVAKVELLEQLRSGRYNDATRQLEALLDKDLAVAAETAHNGIKLDQDTLKALETERKARGITGYEPADSKLGASVQAAFRLVARPEVAVQTPVIFREDIR